MPKTNLSAPAPSLPGGLQLFSLNGESMLIGSFQPQILNKNTDLHARGFPREKGLELMKIVGSCSTAVYALLETLAGQLRLAAECCVAKYGHYAVTGKFAKPSCLREGA